MASFSQKLGDDYTAKVLRSNDLKKAYLIDDYKVLIESSSILAIKEVVYCRILSNLHLLNPRSTLTLYHGSSGICAVTKVKGLAYLSDSFLYLEMRGIVIIEPKNLNFSLRLDPVLPLNPLFLAEIELLSMYDLRPVDTLNLALIGNLLRTYCFDFSRSSLNKVNNKQRWINLLAYMGITLEVLTNLSGKNRLTELSSYMSKYSYLL